MKLLHWQTYVQNRLLTLALRLSSGSLETSLRRSWRKKSRLHGLAWLSMTWEHTRGATHLLGWRIDTSHGRISQQTVRSMHSTRSNSDWLMELDRTALALLWLVHVLDQLTLSHIALTANRRVLLLLDVNLARLTLFGV